MANNINKNNGQPLYTQVSNFLLEKINDGSFKAGEVIPTERQLSEKLDVSRYTVRRAIKELVKKGYLYSVQGAGTFVFDKNSPVQNRSNYIGVILNNHSEEFESRILNGVQKGLENENFKMIFKDSKSSYIEEAKNIQELKNNKVAGMIIMPAEDQSSNEAIISLKEENFPFVLVDRFLHKAETNAVVSDNIDGAYKATQHLIELGHSNIAFVKNKFTKTSSIEDRITGFKRALKDYDLDDSDKNIFSYDGDFDDKKLFSQLFNFIKDNNISAVVALNDYVALRIMKMCTKKKIDIPADLSLVGFDNRGLTEHLSVPLTTVAQYPELIGERAIKLLIEIINDQEDLIHKIYCPTKLIERESCTEKKRETDG